MLTHGNSGGFENLMQRHAGELRFLARMLQGFNGLKRHEFKISKRQLERLYHFTSDFQSLGDELGCEDKKSRRRCINFGIRIDLRVGKISTPS